MSMAIKYAMKKRQKMAEGGETFAKGVHTTDRVAHLTPERASPTGSQAGNQIRRGVGEFAKDEHKRVLGEMKDMRRDRQNLAEGGEVCHACEGGTCMEHGGTVDRIMAKRYSKGGEVANDTPPIADDMEADYDDLALRDELESSYDGANSGDEDGGLAPDDMVDRIMMKRKKDRMPRPA